MELTRDVFLGGRLPIWQPRDGYRAATDPVLLAASVPASPGARVLELGCGVGVAMLSLATRVPGVILTGVERQGPYAALARRNAEAAGIAATVIDCDLTAMPAELRAQRFDFVLMNPPYFPPAAPPARDPGRDLAQREDTPLDHWVDAALRRLEPGGWLHVIHLAPRLPDLLAALAGRAGDIQLRPLAPRAGRDAGRVILRARKGAKGPFRLLPPLILHGAPVHPGDQRDDTPQAEAILREAAPLDWDSATRGRADLR
jgi:tRNA1Val (adenine37-N6)-methyltransferase